MITAKHDKDYEKIKEEEFDQILEYFRKVSALDMNPAGGGNP